MLTIEKKTKVDSNSKIEKLLRNSKLFKGLINQGSKLALSCQSLDRMQKLPKHKITNWTWAHALQSNEAWFYINLHRER